MSYESLSTNGELSEENVIYGTLMDSDDSESEWEYENIDLDLERGLGISIRGGTDSTDPEYDSSIYVSRLLPNGAAMINGRLQLGDIILSVNDTRLYDVTHQQAVQAIINAGKKNIRFLVKRRKSLIYEQIMEEQHQLTPVPPEQKLKENINPEPEPPPPPPVIVRSKSSNIAEIELIKADKGFGFSISGGVGNQHIKGDNGIYITKIAENGVAAVDGRLEVGDKLIAVNEFNLQEISYELAVQHLRQSPNRTVLTVVKKT